MDSVLQLLDELEDVMDSSKAVPFSSKVTVNKEEIYDIISEIRMKRCVMLRGRQRKP